jgi:hypothetical protein
MYQNFNERGISLTALSSDKIPPTSRQVSNNGFEQNITIITEMTEFMHTREGLRRSIDSENPTVHEINTRCSDTKNIQLRRGPSQRTIFSSANIISSRSHPRISPYPDEIDLVATR